MNDPGRKTGYATMIESAADGRVVIMTGSLTGLEREFRRQAPTQKFDHKKVYFVELKQLRKGGDFPAVNIT